MKKCFIKNFFFTLFLFLGHNTYHTMKKVPEQVITLPEIGMVSCGFNHTLAISIDGLTAFAFGDGDHGKLGLGHCTSRNSPTGKLRVQKFYQFNFYDIISSVDGSGT